MKSILLFYIYIILAIALFWISLVFLNRKKINFKKQSVPTSREEDSDEHLNFLCIFSVNFRNFFAFYASFFTLFVAQFFFYLFEQEGANGVRWYYWGSFAFVCIVWFFSICLVSNEHDCE